MRSADIPPEFLCRFRTCFELLHYHCGNFIFVLAGVPSVLFSLLLFLFILVWAFQDVLLCTYLYKALLSLCL